MTRRVYLHVGAPKTGTTYLQDRLALNRTELARHGVHYPLGLSASHFRAALDLIEQPWGGQLAGARGEWDKLAERVRRLEGTVVISHEILAAAKPKQVRRAMGDLGDSEVHLVYSARDLARQIPAEWQEGIKHRRRRSFARFLSQVQANDRKRSTMWFWRVQGLPGVLTRWGAGLPPERVHLVTVPSSGADPGLLWQRYCTAFGIDPAWAPHESNRANASIGAAETALLRKLNRRLRDASLASDDYRRLVRQLIVHETLARRPGMDRALLPPAAYPWAEQRAERWIEWVRDAGIDVIGDLDDLRPTRPDEGKAWHDPDAPRKNQMIDASIDALVALLTEAAKRPDPEEQIGARLGRAARRLRGQ